MESNESFQTERLYLLLGINSLIWHILKDVFEGPDIGEQ